MGRNRQTYRDEIDSFKDEYGDFRRALRRERQDHFDSVFRQMREIAHTGQAQGPTDRREAMLLSVLITQEERIAALEKELDMEYRYVREGDWGTDLDSFVSPE